MKNVALITGASSGIGKELARIHASRKNDLVIVARRKEELEKLKSELEHDHSVMVKIIEKDLSQPYAAKEIYDELNNEGITIEYLMNNAGFGGHGKFHERPIDKDMSMIDVNVKALVSLTRLFLPGMLERNRGRILNVSSTAGFIPGPYQSVYYATKAFVNSFSQAVAEEVRHKKITVTALCPGLVRTEFIEISGMNNLKYPMKGKSAYSVARYGYKKMLRGRDIVINEFRLRIALKYLLGFMPRRLVLKISKLTMTSRED